MILNNATLVTFWPSEPLVTGALVAIEGKTIVDFGEVGKLIDRYDDPEVLDVGGRLVIPGLVNVHDRLYLRLLPGLPTSGVEARASLDLRALRLRIESALDEEALYWSAVTGLLDALRAGVTTVFALSSSPMHVEGSLEVLARALSEVGVRGSLAYALSPRSSARVALSELRRHLEVCRARPSELLQGLVGLESTSALDGKVLAEAADLGAPVHAVLGGSASEDEACPSRYGVTAARRLQSAGLLRDGGLAVLEGAPRPEDERALEDSGAFVAHAPQASAAQGEAAPDLLRAGASGQRLALGTDGLGGSVAQEFRAAALQQRAKGHDLGDAIRLAYRSAFVGNAELASRIFGAPVGLVKPGARADLVVLDYWPSTPLSAGSLPEHLFFALPRAPVHTVIVNGTVLYQNGRFLQFDEGRLRARARETARATWERI